MSLVTLDNIYLSYSDAPLFDHTSLSIEEHDRIAIVGRNGAGRAGRSRFNSYYTNKKPRLK